MSQRTAYPSECALFRYVFLLLTTSQCIFYREMNVPRKDLLRFSVVLFCLGLFVNKYPILLRIFSAMGGTTRQSNRTDFTLLNETTIVY